MTIHDKNVGLSLLIGFRKQNLDLDLRFILNLNIPTQAMLYVSVGEFSLCWPRNKTFGMLVA